MLCFVEAEEYRQNSDRSIATVSPIANVGSIAHAGSMRVIANLGPIAKADSTANANFSRIDHAF